MRACGRDGFEARVHAQRPQQMPNVIADRLLAEVELGRDLRGRTTVLEQMQDLCLARS